MNSLRSSAFAALTIASLVALSGCAVGPDYKAPVHDTKPTWTNTGAGVADHGDSVTSGDTADLITWWKTFNDPALDSLVARAVEANPSLKQAASRVLQARALLGVAGAGRFPTIDASGDATRSQRSENVKNQGPSGSVNASNLFSGGLDATWELDLFGGIRRGVESADADLAAAEWSRRDVLVSLIAEVCSNYTEYRGAQRRLDVVTRSIRVQEETLQVAAARAKAGIASDLEVAQATAQLETRRAQAPQIRVTLKQSLHRLGVLLGKDPSALYEELSVTAPIPSLPPRIATGLPSELLLRRPDIRRAERQLAASTARIGVATADLYPRFSLSGYFHLESSEIKTWPEWSSKAWSVGPSVRWNIFDANRIRNSIKAAGYREQEALALWDQTVLGAFEEVENRLVSYTQEQDRHVFLNNAVTANRRAVDLSNDLYKAGVRDFLNVLDSERALFDTEDQLVLSEIVVTTNLIALYKSLGGGWEEPSSPASDASMH